MTTLSPRDALEVVRLLAGGYKDREHALASGDVPIALAVLSELVERAGEPVAWREVVRATGRVRSHIDWQPTADMIEASDMEEADWQPLYYIPPTAPGASHE